jgi:cytidine deaminase
MRRPTRLTDLAPEFPAGVAALNKSDLELVEAVCDVLRTHYRPFWHTVAAAVRDGSGRVWTGLHLGATVGRLQICAEAVAVGRAVLEGDGYISTIVAVRHPKPDEEDRSLAVVSPCGGCRELLFDFGPDAWVIIPLGTALVKLPARALLPLPYRR